MLQKANTNVIGTKRPPMNLWLFICGKYWFFFKERQPYEVFWKTYLAVYGEMLHKNHILIQPVMAVCMGESGESFALVQTNCQVFHPINGSHSYLQAAAED